MALVTPYNTESALRFFRRASVSGMALMGHTITTTSPRVRLDSKGEDGYRFDADGINLLRDFTVRLGKVYEDKFPALRALDFIPTADMQLTSTSQAYLGEFLSRVGRARIITEISTDIPEVKLKGQTFTGRIATVGAAGVWSQEDIARGSMGTVNIPVKTQQGAREAIETEVDNLLALGQPEAGIPGFLKHPDVSIVPLPLGNWPTRTFSQILDDFHNWMGLIRARVNYNERSKIDTVLFPPSVQTAMVRKRPVNPETDNAWNAIVREAKEQYGITVDTWSKLETAGATGGPRIVAYRRDSDCLGAVYPLPYLQFNPQEDGLLIKVPAIAKVGGTLIIEPATVTYADNAAS